MEKWKKQFREEMPICEHWAYFDHAAVAPITKSAHNAIRHWSDQALGEGDVNWLQWSKGVERTRNSAARLIGATVEEIALIRSTTEGISFVAEGFPWQSGDNVVTLDNEFPSNCYPWLNLKSRGVETRRVSTVAGGVDLDSLAQACDSRTRIVSVSWVGYVSGWRCDVAELAELAHSHGALLMLDAIQGLGVFPLDVRETDIDFLAADGHKWMLGPEGAGILYLKREHLDLLRPLQVGWNSVKQAHDFSHIKLDLKDSAARYEAGSQNMAGMLTWVPALRNCLNLVFLASRKRCCESAIHWRMNCWKMALSLIRHARDDIVLAS